MCVCCCRFFLSKSFAHHTHCNRLFSFTYFGFHYKIILLLYTLFAQPKIYMFLSSMCVLFVFPLLLLSKTLCKWRDRKTRQNKIRAYTNHIYIYISASYTKQPTKNLDGKNYMWISCVFTNFFLAPFALIIQSIFDVLAFSFPPNFFLVCHFSLFFFYIIIKKNYFFIDSKPYCIICSQSNWQ